MSDVSSCLGAIAERFAYDPLGFVLWAFPWRDNAAHPLRQRGICIDPDGHGLEDWQAETFALIGQSMREQAAKPASCTRVTVVSGHGIGKGAFAGMLAVWWFVCHPYAKGVLSANKLEQARTKTWTELRKWHAWLHPIVQPMLEIGAERMRNTLDPDRWFLSMQAWSADNPSAFAGEHSAWPFMLFDEASEFPPIIYEVTEGVFSEGHGLWVTLGNGTCPQGPFYDSHNAQRHRWIARSVDARTIRRPHNADLMDEWVREYGEDSDFVRVRVRGMFPRSGFNQFIPQSLIDDARARRLDRSAYEFAPKVIGCDVAWMGADQSVMTLRQGLWLPTGGRRAYRGLSPIEIGDKLISFIDEVGPDVVFVDGNGVGAGTVARLREFGYRCVNVGAAGTLAAAKAAASRKGAAEECGDLWTLLWAGVRDWLRDGGSLHHASPELIKQLGARKYSIDVRTGLVKLEPKSVMDESPDDADSLACTFAGPAQRRSAAAGRTIIAGGFDPREVRA